MLTWNIIQTPCTHVLFSTFLDTLDLSSKTFRIYYDDCIRKSLTPCTVLVKSKFNMTGTYSSSGAFAQLVSQIVCESLWY